MASLKRRREGDRGFPERLPLGVLFPRLLKQARDVPIREHLFARLDADRVMRSITRLRKSGREEGTEKPKRREEPCHHHLSPVKVHPGLPRLVRRVQYKN